MSHNSREQDRVNHEQDYVKEKGYEAKDAAHRIKEGDISAPTTHQVTSKLEQGERALDNLKHSERGNKLDGTGEKVVDDLKRVLEDQRTLFGGKNEGDILQNIVRHIWALMQELKQNPQLKDLLDDWQSNVTSMMSSGDFVQFFHQTGALLTNMKDTEEFLSLASELIDITKVLVAESTEKATESDPSMLADYGRQKDLERQRLITEVTHALRALSNNHMWSALVARGKHLGGQVKEASYVTNDTAQEALHRIHDSTNFQELVAEFRTLLQRLVGNQMSVDNLFEYSRRALEDITNDSELSQVLHEYQRCLSELAEDPSLLELHGFQDRLESLSGKADKSMERLRNDRNIIGAKEESQKVAAAIKNDPENVKMLIDLKSLYHDVISDRPGQILDPEVLRNLKGMVVPLLIEHLHNVPVPDISDSFSFLGKTFYTLSDMKISLPELIPESVHMRFEYEMDASPLHLEATNQHTYLYVQADNIQVNLKNVNFSYERKTLPKLHDSGVFDVHTLGSGLTVWMKMSLRSDDKKGQYLDVLKSDVRLDRFAINFHESKHDKMYEMMTHLFAGRIKKAVVDGTKQKLEMFGTYFNDQILTVINEARTRSSDISSVAKTRAETARSGFERLRLQAKDNANSYAKDPSVQEQKEDAKSTAKGLVYRASDKVQVALDNQQSKIEQQRLEKQMDGLTVDPYASTITADTWKTATPAATHPTL